MPHKAGPQVGRLIPRHFARKKKGERNQKMKDEARVSQIRYPKDQSRKFVIMVDRSVQKGES